MDSEEVHKGGDDSPGVSGYSECTSKLNLLGNCIKKLEKEIVSSRNCFYYILKEMNLANEHINKEIAWNNKRGELLKEIADKNCIYYDKLQSCYKEYFELYKLCEKIDKIKLNK